MFQYLDELLENKPVRLAIFAFLAAASILYTGYFFNGYDNSFLFAFMNKIIDSSLYANDACISYTANNYFSFFQYLLAAIKLVSGVFGLQVFMFSILFAARFFVFYFVYKISTILFKSRAVALLACLLFITPKPLLSDSMFFNYTKVSELMFPVLLFSISEFLQKKYNLAFLAMGLSFNLHPMYSATLLPMLLLIMLVKRVKIAEIGKSLVIFLVASMPMLLWFVASGQLNQASASLNGAWANYIKLISWNHYDPFLWYPSAWAFFFAIPLLFVFYLNDKGICKPESGLHRTVMLFALATILLNIAAFFFTYVVPSRIVMVFLLYRSTKFLVPFMLIYIANYLYALSGKGGSAKLLAISAYLFIFTGQANLLFYALPFFAFAYAGKKARAVLKVVLIAELVVIGISVILPNFAISIIEKLMEVGYKGLSSPYYARRAYDLLIGDSTESILMIAVFLAAYCSLANKPFMKGKIAFALLTAAIVAFSLLSPSGPLRMQSDQYYLGSIAGERAWYDAQIAAKALTPKDAVILTPPYLRGFRVYSERSEFVTELDGGQGIVTSPAYAPVWTERMASLGYTDIKYDIDPKVYQALEEGKLAQLVQKYNITYALFPEPKHLNLDVTYENDYFVLYDLKGLR